MNYLNHLIFLILFFIEFKIYAGSHDIVVIESYSKNYKWNADYTTEIQRYLGKKYKLTFFELNNKRLPKPEHEKIALKAWDLILKTQPILVILGDDAALKYLGIKLDQQKIPTVYLGVNNNPRAYFKLEPKYITGVLERPLLRRSAAYIKEIIPNVKNVLILFDNDRTSEIVFEEFFSKRPSINLANINYEIFLIDTYEKWKKKINDSKNKYDAIILGLCSTLTDENKKNVDTEEVIKWTSNNSAKPLFAFWDFAVGKNKAIGGLVLTGEGQGKTASKIAEKILNNPTNLPISIFPVYLQEGKFIFSKYGLQKYNINLPLDIKKRSYFVD